MIQATAYYAKMHS